MKNIIVKKFDHAEVDAPKETFGFAKIPAGHTIIRAEGEDLEVSDGFHTMDELYDHRITIYIALCKAIVEKGSTRDAARVYRSKVHADGSIFEGWFIVGIDKEAGKQISYHLPLERWDETDFITEIDRAPEWDGHTPADVLMRLKLL